MRCSRCALYIYYKMTKSGGFGKSPASRDVLISEYAIGMHAGISFTLSQITFSISVPTGNAKSFCGGGRIPYVCYLVA